MFMPQSRSLSLLCNSTCYESWRLGGRSHCQEIGTILIEFYRLNDGLRSVESVRLQLSKSQIDGVVLEKSKSRPNILTTDHLSCSLPNSSIFCARYAAAKEPLALVNFSPVLLSPAISFVVWGRKWPPGMRAWRSSTLLTLQLILTLRLFKERPICSDCDL